MKKTVSSVQDIFLKLGSTPVVRSVRAASVFRRLRDAEPPPLWSAPRSAESSAPLARSKP